MTTPDPIRAALERLINAVLDGLAHDDHPMGWARVDDAIAAARAALDAAPAERETVAIPRSADAAAAMVMLGTAYLREHAPERLRPATPPAPAAGEPPAELVEQWMREASDQPPGPDARVIAALAARWGAAQITERRPAPAPDGEVGPSDDDLALVYHDCCGGCELMDQGGFEDAARAVLARWGRGGCGRSPCGPPTARAGRCNRRLHQRADRGPGQSACQSGFCVAGRKSTRSAGSH